MPDGTEIATQGGALRRSEGSPLPTFNAQQMAQALAVYKELQRALDEAMPEQIMDLEGKKFRKKGYWRAVAVAFNITVDTVEEKREVAGLFGDGRPNFGYVVSKKATAPNGRSVIGDGACFAVEKARRFKCPHPESPGSRRTLHFPHSSCPEFDPEFQWRTLPGDASEHNVRGHAATRAFNRAVSDLVGFGEVSAEEVDHEEPQEGHAARPSGHGRTQAANQGTAQAAGQPTTAAAPGTTYVKDIAIKTGKSSKGPWTRRFVTFEDGRDGVTFSDTLAEELAKAKANRTPVNPEIEKGDKGNDLKGLRPITPAEAPAQPDEPVDGPEKILTVRKVVTDKGDRWVIQTAKRQLITDNGAHADEAVKARDAKLGVVPSFDVVDLGGGKHANRLKALAVEAREPGEEG